MSLTIHVDVPTDDPAQAWSLAAAIASLVEQHFELEVDAEDLCVTQHDWAEHVDDPDDGEGSAWDDWSPRPVQDVVVVGGVL